MKPPKKAEPLANPIDPVRIERRSYRPDQMTAEQQRAMSAAAQSVIDAYLPLMSAMVAALNSQRDNAGNKSSTTVYQIHTAHREVGRFVEELAYAAVPPVQFPKLPQVC